MFLFLKNNCLHKANPVLKHTQLYFSFFSSLFIHTHAHFSVMPDSRFSTALYALATRWCYSTALAPGSPNSPPLEFEVSLYATYTKFWSEMFLRLSFLPLLSSYVTHPSAEARGEVVKDEVRESLRHGPDVRDVVSHHHVVQGEIRRRSEGQVAHDESV